MRRTRSSSRAAQGSTSNRAGGSTKTGVANGTVVATLTGVDPDGPGGLAFSLETNADGKFKIVGNEIQVADKNLLIDPGVYGVKVKLSDGQFDYFEDVFITVAQGNKAPTDIALTNTSVAENSTSGAEIGLLSATDPDPGSSFTFFLESNPGNLFDIQGGKLVVAAGAKLDADKGPTSHTITIKVDDGQGGTFSKDFTINITNVNKAPSDIGLSTATVKENTANGTPIGTLTAVDQDAGSTFSFKLTDDPSKAFAIVGNQLVVADKQKLNFEAGATQTIKVQVSDGALTFEKSLTIALEDVNEAPTDISIDKSTVEEKSAPNTVVGTFSGVDPDAGDSAGLRFKILSDPSGAFAIDGKGALVVADGTKLNSATNPAVTLDIEATDGSGLVYVEQVTISVTHKNNAPTGFTVAGGSVAENAANGTKVATLTAIDADPGDTFTYSISGDPDGVFAISNNDIVVANGALLNFEVGSTQTISVTVKDKAGGTFTKDVTIAVTDINEAPNDLQLAGNTVAEGAAADTVVGTLTGFDPDFGATLSYSIAPGGNGAFKVVGDKLQVADGSLLDFEGSSSHTASVTVRVSDGKLSLDKTLTVNLTNVNEAPTDILLSNSTIVENTSPVVVGLLSATDPDGAGNYTFELVDDDKGNFIINGDKLEVVSGKSFDFESQKLHTVKVKVTEGALSFTKDLTINVGDVNEAPTDIGLSGNVVVEGTKNGTLVGILTGVDPDAVDVGKLTYALTVNPDNLFEIVGDKLVVKDGSTFNKATTPSYTVNVEVTDSVGHTFLKPFTINVTKDNAPPTDVTLTGGTIPENATNGTFVGKLIATDPNPADKWFTYLLTNDAGGRFDVSGDQIVVKDASKLDFDTDPFYNVTVKVTDPEGGVLSKQVTIKLTNVNEAPTDIALTGGTVAETALVGDVVGTLAMIDPDADKSAKFELTSNPNGLFAIVGNEVRLAKAQLDFETTTSFDIKVKATDGGGLAVEKTLTVKVSNVNEAPTDLALVGDSVNENAAGGTLVGTLSAFDPEGDPITFELPDSAQGRFEIVGNELRVAAGASLDFDTTPTHQVTVIAKDAEKSVSKTFTIKLNPLNETPTDISFVPTVAEVPEDSVDGFVVGTLTGHDPDAGDVLSLALKDNAGGRFVLENNQIKVANHNLLDFDTQQTHSISVEVKDKAGLTITKSFDIKLANVNEAPTGIGLSSSTIAEDAAAGAIVGTLSTTDPDLGDAAGVSYSIVDDTSKAFAISNKNLVIAKQGALDFEGPSGPTAQVTIRAKDAGGKTFDKIFTIGITDANDAPTNVTLVTGTPVKEGSIAGTVVGSLVGTDPDAGDTLTYALLDDAGGRFQVDKDSGQVSVKSTNPLLLDYEAAKSHNITVQVKDKTGAVLVKQVTIDLSNINEAPTGLSVDKNTISEDTPLHGVVVTLTGTDPDAGDTLSYTILSDPDGIFEIDPGSNQLRIKDPSKIDFEKGSTAKSVTINVTDSGGLSFTKALTFNVVNANEAPTDILLDKNTVKEDAGANAIVGSLKAIDPDIGDAVKIAIKDEANSPFKIIGNQLVVAKAGVLDFDTQPQVNVVLVATDSGGKSFEKVVQIDLIDVNEAPTKIEVDGNGKLEVLENAAAGTLIGLFVGTDPDAGDGLKYDLVNDAGGRFELQKDTTTGENTGLLVVKDGTKLDYEASKSHQVAVKVTDNQGHSLTKLFSVSLQNENEAPTGLVLNGAFIASNGAQHAQTGALVGTLEGIDPDAGDTLSTLR